MDSQKLFRDSLRCFLHKHAGLKVVGEAGSGDELVELTAELHPHVILLSSQGMNGTRALGALRHEGLDVAVIVLAEEMAQSEMLCAMRYGAKGFVLKTSTSNVLLKAIRTVSEGQYWLEQENVAALIHAATDGSRRHSASRSQYGLTPREDHIILAVLDGFSNPEIAEKLGLSEQTIKHHLSHIFDKLGVYSRLELALFAVSHQLVEDLESDWDTKRARGGEERRGSATTGGA